MALGRGLDALLGDASLLMQNSGSKEVPINQVEPGLNQPRKNFDQDNLDELSKSIQQYGILQPITVRMMNSGKYQIIAGERRWRAATQIGLKTVPVIIIEADDRKVMEIGLIENLQREDLNPIEEASGYQVLIENYGLTQEEAAERVSKSRPAVANSLRLLGLPKEVQWLIEQGSLSAGHGRALLALKDPDEQNRIANQAVEKKYSVRQIEELIRSITKEKRKQESVLHENKSQYSLAAESLTRGLGRKVTISQGKRKGKVTLEFLGEEDLDRLLKALMNLSEEE